MTLDPKPAPFTWTVAGVGPYGIDFPYLTGAIRASVVLGGLRTELVEGTDFTVAPLETDTAGDLTLSVAAAAAFAGGQLAITRETSAEQGWAGVLGEREAGLEAQLNRQMMLTQEILETFTNAIRLDTPVQPLVGVPGAFIGFALDGSPAVLQSIGTVSVIAWLAALLTAADPATFRSGIGAIAASQVPGLAGATTQITNWDNLHTLARSGPVWGDTAATNGPSAGLALSGYYAHTDANTGELIVGAPAIGASFRRSRGSGTWGPWTKGPRDGPQLTNLDTVGTGVFFNLFDNTATGAMSGLGAYTAILFHNAPSFGTVRTQIATIVTGTHAGRRFLREHNGTAWAAWRPEPVRLAVSATNIAQLDLTLPAGMTRGRLTAEITPATAGATMQARLSTDSGATFIATASYQTVTQGVTTGSTAVGATANLSGTSITLSGAMDPAVATFLSLELGVDTSALLKGDTAYKANGIADRVRSFSHAVLASAGVNAIRLFASTGNFTVRYLWEALP